MTHRTEHAGRFAPLYRLRAPVPSCGCKAGVMCAEHWRRFTQDKPGATPLGVRRLS